MKMFSHLKKVEDKLGPLWWHSGLLFVVSRFADIISLYIGVFLVPEYIAEEKLGAVLPLTRLAVFVAIPLTTLVNTARKYLNFFHVTEQHGKVKAMLRDLFLVVMGLSVLIVFYLWRQWEFVKERLDTQDPNLVWLIGGMAVLSCWRPLVTMAAQSLKQFYRLTFSRLIAPLCRLAIILAVLRQLQLTGYLLASLLSMVVGIGVLGAGLKRYAHVGMRSESYREHLPEIGRYWVPVAIIGLAMALQGLIEPWVIRQRLPEGVSAGYYIAYMFGNIPAYLGGAVVPFLFPLVSERHEKGERTGRIMLEVFAFVAIAGGLTAVVLGFAGSWLLNLREAWRHYSAYAPYMWQISIATTLSVIMACYNSHQLACRRFRHLFFYCPAIALEAILLYSLFGWSFFRGYLPVPVWEAVNTVAEQMDLQMVILFMLGARLATIIAICADIFKGRAKSCYRK